MIGHRSREQLSYRCGMHVRKAAECAMSSISCRKVDEVVINVLQEELFNHKAIQALIPKLKSFMMTKAIESATDVKALRERIAELDVQIDNLVKTIMEMGGSPAIQSTLKTLEKEKA